MRASRTLVAVLVTLSLAASVRAAVAEWQWYAEVPDSPTLALVLTSLVGLAWALTGAVLAWSRPGNPVGWLMLAVGALTQVSVGQYGAARLAQQTESPRVADRPLDLALDIGVGFLIFVLLGLLPLLYPSGRLRSRPRRVIAGAVVVGAALFQAQVLRSELDPSAARPFGDSGGTVGLLGWVPLTLLGVACAAGWVSAVIRVTRSSAPERQQLAWLLAAVVLGLVTTPFVGPWLQVAVLYLLPVAVAVGILRYRLLGIEVVLRRGLVYVVLTLGIVAVQALAAVVVGVRLGGTALTGVVAAAVVAVGLSPARAWLQRGVDRLLYGPRPDPVSAVSDLGVALATSEPARLVDAAVDSVEQSLRPGGLRLEDSSGATLVTRGLSSPPETGSGLAETGPHGIRHLGREWLTVPLVVGGETVGTLHLASRQRDGSWTGAERRLAEALAPQVAVALRALDLNADLEAQRDAVVEARREERERLRHDLHDGLGPSLTGIGLGLQAVDDALAGGDVDQGREIAGVLRAETAATVTEIRRIIDDLRPAGLSSQGLAPALRRAVASIARQVPVEVSVAELPDLPRDVEDAVFRIALEAVTNLTRHAVADRARVSLGRDECGDVVLVVGDDGVGFDPAAPAGVGIRSMRSRADSIGGSLLIDTGVDGTTVRLTVPAAALREAAAATPAPSALTAPALTAPALTAPPVRSAPVPPAALHSAPVPPAASGPTLAPTSSDPAHSPVELVP